ncbi:hypothetical protein QQS21_008920 [Conoideocrella luteorostrata]|uniref:DNA mismatch repair protein S5 domain-containing protein n=1 Tax=Conoideocrella luteorostrata TaxID=1105319 RepID=A0AAJ0CKM5_9HYPO|nr:hypothetical protein QQS21_008920 [Conoideocrella luteorostrata]
MSIHPLPALKELIDNAIDAEANAIEITISSNTIDKISVKDNGTGIDMDDFNSLGRRAHTSKLREFSEMATVGSRTLGFRGEALACINAVARVVITTKKAGDPIAWRIELVSGVGGVKARRPVSATAGTMVAATNLFENMPPRKQFSLKEKKKIVPRLQSLLTAYALARPHIKMMLKIIGENKPVWSYSPIDLRSGREAILQLLGANLLNMCVEINENITIEGDSDGKEQPSQLDHYIISGFLSKPGCNMSDNKPAGIFLSVDKRPMSNTWYVAKKFASILKRQVVQETYEARNVFLQLDIQCPPTRYDPNIAAQKDQVLLVDEKLLFDKFEILCKEILNKHKQLHSPISTVVNPAVLKNEADSPKQIDRTLRDQASQKIETITADEASSVTNGNGASVEQHHVVSCEDSGAQRQSETGQPKIKAAMRVSFKVNMSKEYNNELEEECNEGTIVVEIPRQATPIRSSDVRRKGIHQYFQSVSKGDFEIACDNTATEENAVEAVKERRLADSSHANRPPLQPLTASALNRIRDEAESDQEPQGSFSTVLQANSYANNADREVETSSPQPVSSVIRLLGTDMPRRVSHPSPVTSRDGRAKEDDSRNEVLDWTSSMVLTPPPSDPRLRQVHTNPPTGAPVHLDDTSPTRADTANRSRRNSVRRNILANKTPQEQPGLIECNQSFKRPLIMPRLFEDRVRATQRGQERRGIAHDANALSPAFAT